MIVAISGLSGCGNTTVSNLAAQKLGLKKINYTFRDMAKEKGVAFEALHAQAEKEFPALDLQLDKKLIQMAGEGNCVLGSRLTIWLVDADLKVWLHAPARTRAKRIAEREGTKPDPKAVKARDAADMARYKKLYGVNMKRHEDVCDIEINTERIPAEKVADIIADAAKRLPFEKKRASAKWPKKIRKILDEKTI